jgi:hypothetical protein
MPVGNMGEGLDGAVTSALCILFCAIVLSGLFGFWIGYYFGRQKWRERQEIARGFSVIAKQHSDTDSN